MRGVKEGEQEKEEEGNVMLLKVEKEKGEGKRSRGEGRIKRSWYDGCVRLTYDDNGNEIEVK